MKRADYYINRLLADLPEPKPTTKKANNEGLSKFVCEYEHEGVMCTIAIYATDTIDAAKRLGSIAKNATIRGSA